MDDTLPTPAEWHVDPEWASRAIELAESLEIAFAQPHSLREAAMRLVAIAKHEGCSQIMGASRFGERLAAATVALADNGLRLAATNEDLKHVLVVDGVFVTGAQLVRTVRRIRTKGARTVRPVALVSVSENDVQTPPSLEGLLILGLEPQGG